jgi:lipoprotein-anchoring transpeptidase ErfK/SrfK
VLVIVATVVLVKSGALALNFLSGMMPRGPFGLGPEIRSEAIDPATAGLSLVAVAHTDLDSIIAHTGPDAASEPVVELANDPNFPRHFLAVLDYNAYAASKPQDWIEVLLPIRPNGTTGWLPRSDLDLYENPYRIEIDVSSFHLTVYRQNEIFVETVIGVGTGETPTPIGRFYTADLYEVPTENSLYGPYAFGLSGFSDVLTSFNGGAGIVGIHGTNDESSLGTEISHGCIRIPNDLIIELARTLPLGTPVNILR